MGALYADGKAHECEELLFMSQQEFFPDGLLVVDRRGRIQSWNRRFLDIWGLLEEDLARGQRARTLDTLYQQVADPERFANEASYWHEHLEHVEKGTEIPLRDGRVLERYSSGLSTNEGEYWGRVWFFRDITERWRHREELWRQQSELAQLMRLKVAGELASGLAHEINQPLAAMVTYADACQRLLGSQRVRMESLPDILEKVSQQGLRAGEIVRRLRRLVSYSGPQLESVQINPLVQEVVTLLDLEMRRHQARLVLDLAQDLPCMVADPAQIQQVLVNLIQNALEAMHGAGLVPERRELRIHSHRSETGGIEVCVTDAGPGVSAAVQDRLFQPFVTTKAKGTGLGLWTSQTIAEMHGGRLSVNNLPAGGATFCLTLPLIHNRRDRH